MFLLIGVSPATNAQHDLHVPVLGLEQRELFDSTIDILASVGPRVAIVVDFRVRIGVCEEDCAVLAVVGKGVEEVGQLRGGDLLREEFAGVDVPVAKVGYRTVSIT